MKPVYTPSIQEGLEEYYATSVDMDLEACLLHAEMKVWQAFQAMGYTGMPDIGDLSITDQAMVYLETCNKLAKVWDESFYKTKDLLASAIIQEGQSVLWDFGESWGMDCYYFWSEEVGQISIHDPCGLVQWGHRSAPTWAQEWSGVPRQDLALTILCDREVRRKMARATDIFRSWNERMPDILEFYTPEELEE